MFTLCHYSPGPAVPLPGNFVSGQSGVGPGEQDWGYVTVRPSAHMFYWLYLNERTTEQPLVIWLQGGPGSSSTGYGNFEEIGIVDTNLNIRNSSWVGKHHVPIYIWPFFFPLKSKCILFAC
jgi:Carboxypeptidase C (cathepsin A)